MFKSLFKKFGIVPSIFILAISLVWGVGLLGAPLVSMLDQSLFEIDRSKSEILYQNIQTEYKQSKKYESKERRYTKKLTKAKQNNDTAKIASLQDKIDGYAKSAKIHKAKGDELVKDYVGPTRSYSLSNYKRFIAPHFNMYIFFKSFLSGIVVTAIALILCYPIAYFMAKIARLKETGLILFLMLIPYGLNELLRGLAWRIILSKTGVINTFLIWSGAIDSPVEFLATDFVVTLGFLYAYAIFLVLPIYSAITSLDNGQLESARDMGASWWIIHRKIVIPHAMPGIASGAIITYLMIVGSIAIPRILGGMKSLWFAQIMADFFGSGVGWGVGSAFAVIMIFGSILFSVIIGKLIKLNIKDIT